MQADIARPYLTVSAAAAAKDAMAKLLYKKIFEAVVSIVNSALSPTRVTKNGFIGVLDIFGFEIFKNNLFSQASH